MKNLDLDEVEYNWNDSIRSYKGSFNLIRTFICKNKSLNKLIYKYMTIMKMNYI